MIALEKHRTDWELKRIKYLATYNDESLPDNTDPEYEIEYIEIGDVDHVNGITHSQELEFEKAPSRARRIVRNGDTLVSTVRTYLKAIAYVDEKFDGSIASTGFAVIRSIDEKKIDPKFLGYCFQDKRLIGEIVSNSQGVSYPAINPSTLARLSIRQPPYTEQIHIAQFLDQKTSQIDRLIEQKEKLLKLLAEKRTAIITQAVTKGLDPNVEMKDSGIKWLGEIPKKWNIKRIKHLTNYIGSGKTPKGGSEVYLREGILFFRSQNIHDDGLRIDDAVFIDDEMEQKQLPNTKTQDFDILLNITGASLGRCNFIPEGFQRANVNQHVCIIRSDRDKVTHQYLHYSIISAVGKSQIQSFENGSSREGLSFPQVGNIQLCMPDLSEQNLIVNYLNDKTKIFNKSIESLTGSISKLKEYREALITSAVTGQIDVSSSTSDTSTSSTSVTATSRASVTREDVEALETTLGNNDPSRASGSSEEPQGSGGVSEALEDTHNNEPSSTSGSKSSEQ